MISVLKIKPIEIKINAMLFSIADVSERGVERGGQSDVSAGNPDCGGGGGSHD